MNEFGRVIYDLERCTCHVPDACRDCSKYASGTGLKCMESLMMDALELLKEQEPVEPILVGVNTWTCGECSALLGWEEFTQSGLELVENRFCPECGRRVKWMTDREKDRSERGC